MIFEIRGKQVILSFELFVTKCHSKIVIYYDICKPMPDYSYNFADASAKLYMIGGKI